MFARRVLRFFPQVPAAGPVARIGNMSTFLPVDLTPMNDVQVADPRSKFAVAPLLLGAEITRLQMPQVRTLNRLHPQRTQNLHTKKFFVM